jgi:hypothetical protein
MWRVGVGQAPTRHPAASTPSSRHAEPLHAARPEARPCAANRCEVLMLPRPRPACPRSLPPRFPPDATRFGRLFCATSSNMFSGFHGATAEGATVAGVVGGVHHNTAVGYRFSGTTQTTVRNTWLLAVDRLNVYRAQGWTTACCTRGSVPASPTASWSINNGVYSSSGESSDWQWVAPGIPHARLSAFLQLCAGPGPALPRQGFIRVTQACRCCRCCCQVRHGHALFPNTDRRRGHPAGELDVGHLERPTTAP